MKLALTLVNILSILPPLVAVTWALVLAREARVEIPGPIIALMLLATWLIYLTDRWLDAARARGNPQTLRHSVQWRWRRVLFFPWLGAGIACAVLLPRIPILMLEEGLLMLAAIGVYLGLVSLGMGRRTHPLAKETCLAFVFAFGSALPSLALGRPLPGSFMAMWLAYTALCFFNLVQVTRWEIPISERRPLRRRSLFVASLLVIVAGGYLAVTGGAFAIPLLALGLLLIVSAPFGERLEIDERVALADLALLLPALLVLA